MFVVDSEGGRYDNNSCILNFYLYICGVRV